MRCLLNRMLQIDSLTDVEDCALLRSVVSAVEDSRFPHSSTIRMHAANRDPETIFVELFVHVKVAKMLKRLVSARVMNEHFSF